MPDEPDHKQEHKQFDRRLLAVETQMTILRWIATAAGVAGISAVVQRLVG